MLYSIDRDSSAVHGAGTDVTIAGCIMQQEIVVPPEQKGFYYGFTKLELGSVWWPVPPVDRCLPLKNRILLLQYTTLAGYRLADGGVNSCRSIGSGIATCSYLGVPRSHHLPIS